MKCIHCKHDCTYPQRRDRKCPQCSRAFAFEPREGDPMSDMAFQSAIDAVSANSAVRFLEDHLYYELARRARRKQYGGRVWLAATGAWLLGGLIWSSGLLLLAPLSGALAYAFRRTRTIAYEREKFRPLLEKWKRAHGAPRMLILRKPQEKSGKYREHADLESYSFDRAVICDRAETVDVLLANNFHFENNCAVLAIDGYPQRAFDTVRAMLRKNPRLSVYALHDASVRGCTMAHELANHPAWFKGIGRVVEVGLRPIHARRFVGLWRSETLDVQPGPGISSEDAVWLSLYSLELAAIRPEPMIKRLFRAMSTEPTQQEDGYYVEDLLVGDASASDGGDDGFG